MNKYFYWNNLASNVKKWCFQLSPIFKKSELHKFPKSDSKSLILNYSTSCDVARNHRSSLQLKSLIFFQRENFYFVFSVSGLVFNRAYIALNYILPTVYKTLFSAQALHCDGQPNMIQLQPNKLTAISFPPFYDPLRPFQLPSYEKWEYYFQ